MLFHEIIAINFKNQQRKIHANASTSKLVLSLLTLFILN